MAITDVHRKSTRLLRGTNADTPCVGKCRRTQIHLSSFASHPREKQACVAPGEVADRRFLDPFGGKAACGSTSGVFLHGPEAQAAFVELGFRPLDKNAGTPASVAALPQPARLFTIAELGGWDQVSNKLFGPQGLWTKIVEDVAKK